MFCGFRIIDMDAIYSSRGSTQNLPLSDESLSPATLKVHTFADRLFTDFAALLLEGKEESLLTSQLIPLKSSDNPLLALCHKIIIAKLEATRSLKCVPQKAVEGFYFISMKAVDEISKLKEEIVAEKPTFFNSVDDCYLKMSPEDFQKEFYDSTDRPQMRAIALEKIAYYKEKATPTELPKVREWLFKMFSCDDLIVQQQALKELIELIETDPLIDNGSDKLIQLHDDILALLDESKRKYFHPALLPVVIKLYALILELILLYRQPRIVVDEMKHQAWEKAEALVLINSSEDPEIKFWGDYAKECAKNLETLTSESDEWIMRLGLVLRATTTAAAGVMNPSSVKDTIESCVEDLKKAAYHIEFKKEWFLPLLTTKRLCHLALNDPAAFQQIIPLIQQLKHNESPEMLQGIIVILESVALLTEDKRIQVEVLKLLIQYAHLQDEAVSYRIIKALNRIYNNKLKPVLSYTAYFLLRLIEAARRVVGKEAEDLLKLLSGAVEHNQPYIEWVIYYFLKGFSEKKLPLREGGKSLINALIPSTHPEIVAILNCLAKLAPHKAIEQDEYGNTPYHMAAVGGYTRLVEQIHSSELEINIDEPEFFTKNTALHLAAENGFKDTCQALLNAKANQASKNSRGNTPLHLAVMGGHLACVTVLMEAGSDPRELNMDGKTPFDLAIESDRSKILELLITKNLFNDPLLYAASIIRATKQQGKQALQVLLTHSSTIPTFAALEIKKMKERENPEEFNTFHHKKMQDDHQYRSSFHPLYSLSQMVTTLDQAAADPEKSHLIPELIKSGQPHTYLGLSPLHIAVLHNNLEGAKLLLDHKKDVNTPDEIRKFTPMHIAVYTRNLQMIELLLKYKPNLNAQTVFGDTPLHMAALNNEVEERVPIFPPLHDKPQPKYDLVEQEKILETLLEKVDKEHLPTDRFGNNLLHLAVLHNQLSLIPLLTKTCPGLFWQRNQNQLLPIENTGGRLDIAPMIRALLEGVVNSELVGSNQNLSHLSELFYQKTNKRVPLLHVLVAARMFDNAKLVLQENPQDALLQDASYSKKTALHVAAKAGLTTFISLYSNHLDVADHFLNTAGHVAIILEQFDFAKEWVLAGGDVTAKNRDGSTLTHLAALKGNVEFLIFLKERGAFLNQADGHQRLPLHHAALNGFYEAVVYLLDQYPEGVKQRDENGMTPLHFTCLCPYQPAPIVRTTTRELNTTTLLMRASSFFHLPTKRHKSVIPYFPPATESMLSTISPSPPSSPPSFDSQRTLIHLISKGCDPEAQDISGMTPLMLAAANGQNALVILLLGHDRGLLPDFQGVDIRKKDYDLRTALHHATMEEQVDVIRILLIHDAGLARPKEKAIAIQQDINLEHPLHLIAKKRNGYREHKDNLVEISKLFIVEGLAKLGQPDENGKTEVHWAAENGLTQLMIHFLDLTNASPFRNQRPAQIAPDRQGRTPLHLAAMNDCRDAVYELLRRGLSPNVKDNEGLTPFLHVAKLGFTPTARLLITAHTDLKVCDRHKNTIIHLILQKDNITSEDQALLLEVLRRAPELSIACNSSTAGKKCPIHVAAEKGHTEMIHFLVKYMGKTREAQVRHLWSRDGKQRTAGRIAEALGHKTFAATWLTIKQSDLTEGWHRGFYKSKVYPLPFPDIKTNID